MKRFLALALLAALPLAAPAQAAAADVTVTVNTRAGLETAADTAVGVNHAIWDQHLGSNEVADLLKNAGVGMMRYPGGSYSDIYHWADHTAPGGYVAPNTDFDTFMAGVRRAGGQPIVTANYGTGTAAEAAGWVRYANVEKDYGVRYWEIGNENYGNGHYGSAWEADNHADKSPKQYATQVVEYSAAMKAVDPTIKIGAVLTTPGNWPDGITAAGDAGTWNDVVLSIAADSIDYVILHWYPGGSTAEESFANTRQIADIAWAARRQIAEHTDKPLGIAMTEVNTSYGKNTQPGALFAADAYPALIAAGVFTVDWWNVHNGMGRVTEIAGQTDYDDWGLLSSANCTADGATCQPPLNTPFGPYFGLAMTSRFLRGGDQLVAAGSSDPLVKAHAARRPNGDLAVLLINQDPAADKSVSLRYAGYAPAATAQVHRFGHHDTAISTGAGAADSVTLPPYSLTTLVLRPATPAATVPTPGRPTAADVTATTAKLSWPAIPGVKYEIHRQNGAATEQWGETTGTSFTVHNLKPGARYTANVIARDNAGRVSWASPPVTFQTLSPASAGCSVRYNDDNNWGNGFVADLAVTSAAALPTWTLEFAWPTGWQQMTSGWNATWTQTGRIVRAVGAAPLAAGGSTNIGFVGAYQGPNLTPPLFRLNGTLCATLP